MLPEIRVGDSIREKKTTITPSKAQHQNKTKPHIYAFIRGGKDLKTSYRTNGSAYTFKLQDLKTSYRTNSSTYTFEL